MSVLLACGAAFLCGWMNRLLYRFFGLPVILTYGPVVEELTKSIPAYYLSVDLVLVHWLFGTIEAVYDWRQRTDTAKGIIAVGLSVVGHTLFGLTTKEILRSTGNLWLAVSLVILLHMVWNAAVIRMKVRR